MTFVPKYIKNNEKIGNCSKKRLPYVLKKEHLLKILRMCQHTRLVMVIFLGIFQGLRISEIVKLKWTDVDLEYGEIKVLDAKNPKRYKSNYGKDRIVPINDMFIPVLKKWRALNPDSEYVIDYCDRFGVRVRDKAIKKHFQDKFLQYIARAGLLEVDYYQKDGKPRYKYHMHTLRHVCGTNLYRAGMDIYQVKEFLGHEGIQTTQVYCELAKDDLRLASHKAYAFPASQLPMPDQPQIKVAVDKEALKLQKEILERQLDLTRLKARPIMVNY